MGEIRINGEIYGTSEAGADVDTLKDIYYGSLEERQLLANAITNKGIETNTADSLATMAENISHIYEGGNAIAAQITKGYSAWVNGALIQGTRPAIVTLLTGSSTMPSQVGNKSVTQTVNVTFSKAFDKIPTISLTVNKPSITSSCSALNITKTGFTIKHVSSYSSDWETIVVTWRAEA